ncbi:MAG: PorP/SprF family type IX secretion system membrane protein [Bacteroidia bacterium]
MKRFCLFIGILVFSAPAAFAQDIHFSQITETPMHLNPANTGLFDGLFRVTMNYRSQWAAMGKPYTTAAAAFDMPLLYARNRAYMGIGAFIYRDQAGDSKFGTFQASLSATGIVPLNDFNKLSVGLQAGFAQRSATIDGLQWENQYVNGSYDPLASPNETNLLTSFPFADFSGGAVYQYRNVAGNVIGKDVSEFSVGVGAFHLNKPEQKFHQGGDFREQMRFVFHGNGRFDFKGTKWSLRPSAYYMQQGKANELVFGSLLRYRIKNGTKVTNFFSESGLGFGVHYRLKDAIIPQIYYDLGDIFIGVSYDVNVSKYTAASKYSGGFEVTLRYANMNAALYKNKK